ncbi:NAD-dependent dehydratase [Sesbania bispinosa]|nr:NAD-dependent dehydratase [Sesbania bispinosa]
MVNPCGYDDNNWRGRANSGFWDEGVAMVPCYTTSPQWMVVLSFPLFSQETSLWNMARVVHNGGSVVDEQDGTEALQIMNSMVNNVGCDEDIVVDSGGRRLNHYNNTTNYFESPQRRSLECKHTI